MIFFDRSICTNTEPKINVFSSAAQFGITPFEGIAAYRLDGGRLKILDGMQHIRRFLDSAARLEISHEYDIDYLRASLLEYASVFNQSATDDFTLRVTLVVEAGGWHGKLNGLLAIKAMERDNTTRMKPKSISLVAKRRISTLDLDPQVKVGANYLNSRYGYLEARNRGSEVAVFTDLEGNICEAMGSGIAFISSSGEVIFTKSGHGKLASITERRIKNFELVRFSDEYITPKVAFDFEECFLFGTSLEITPVNSIELNGRKKSLKVTRCNELREKFIKCIKVNSEDDINVVA